ncbi:hypothetical protein M3697_14805 [Janibacter melonis]|uniref:hypothetical protein n=1 Tax=Janibacter melonis TaxID=262209 RepID=UPI002042D836|nr:hypothetical protein [Janibacter melonis]MCM3556358.1 hypothetical protein [Janibacter melonis]
MTSKQAVRQAARQAALEAQSRMRENRKAKDKRLSSLGVEVMVSLGERDAAVGMYERRAGAALRQMLEEESLTLREAAQWCGEGLSQAEARRLRALAEDELDVDGPAGLRSRPGTEP